MLNNSTTHDSSKRKEREHSKVPPLLTGIKKGCNISEVVMIELHSMDRIIIEDNFHFFTKYFCLRSKREMWH
jgi:hypothetical protein